MSSETPKPLQASDFKAMLQTPMRNNDGDSQDSQRKVSIKAGPKRHLEKERKQSMGQRMPPPGSKVNKQNAKSNKPNAKYQQHQQQHRDRAEERRQGINPDYANDAALLEKVGLTPMMPTNQTGSFATPFFNQSGIPGVQQTPGLPHFMSNEVMQQYASIQAAQGSIPNPEKEEVLTEEEISKKRQEFLDEQAMKSKELGGDEKRTHLVKGLDFELLRKTESRLKEEHFQKEIEKNLDNVTANKQHQHQQHQHQQQQQQQKQQQQQPQNRTVPKQHQQKQPQIYARTAIGNSILLSLTESKQEISSSFSNKAFITFDSSLQDISEAPRMSVRSGLLSSTGPAPIKCQISSNIIANLSRVVAEKIPAKRHKKPIKSKEATTLSKQCNFVKLIGKIAINNNNNSDNNIDDINHNDRIENTANDYTANDNADEELEKSTVNNVKNVDVKGGENIEKSKEKKKRFSNKLFDDVGSDSDDDDSDDDAGKDTAKQFGNMQDTLRKAALTAYANRQQQQHKQTEENATAHPISSPKAPNSTTDPTNRTTQSDDDIPDEPIQMPSAEQLKRFTGVDDEYAECFPDSWSRPNTKGFGAGILDVDDMEGDDDDHDSKKGGSKKGNRLEKMKQDAKIDRQFKQFQRASEKRKAENQGEGAAAKRTKNS